MTEVAQNEAAAPEEQSTLQKILGFASRILTFWMIMNFFKGGGNKNTTAPASSTVVTGPDGVVTSENVNSANSVSTPSRQAQTLLEWATIIIYSFT